MNYAQYPVTSDERWDNIANKAYGNPYAFQGIIVANPDVPISDVVPAGTILNIPILEEEQVTTDSELLPPWMIEQ